MGWDGKMGGMGGARPRGRPGPLGLGVCNAHVAAIGACDIGPNSPTSGAPLPGTQLQSIRLRHPRSWGGHVIAKGKAVATAMATMQTLHDHCTISKTLVLCTHCIPEKTCSVWLTAVAIWCHCVAPACTQDYWLNSPLRSSTVSGSCITGTPPPSPAKQAPPSPAQLLTTEGTKVPRDGI